MITPATAIQVYTKPASERAWMEEFGVTAIVDEPQQVAVSLYETARR